MQVRLLQPRDLRLKWLEKQAKIGRYPQHLPEQVAKDIFDLAGNTLPVVTHKMRPGLVGVVSRDNKHRIVWFSDDECDEIIRDIRDKYATCSKCHSAELIKNAKKLCRLCRSEMIRVRPKLSKGRSK